MASVVHEREGRADDEHNAEGSPPADDDSNDHRAALALRVRLVRLHPGAAGSHEKGGVEGEIGRFRRRHLVPVPSVALLAEVNQQIAAADLVDDGRDGVAAGIAHWEPYWFQRPRSSSHTQRSQAM